MAAPLAICGMFVENLANADVLVRMRSRGNLVSVSRGYLVDTQPVN